MPMGRIGNRLSKRVHDLETNFLSGYMKVLVVGSSTGFGGIHPPVYVYTPFLVKAAVGNLAREYDLRDAAEIYNFGDNIYAGEMRCSLPGVSVGFYVEYNQLDPNESWELTFNWYARG